VTSLELPEDLVTSNAGGKDLTSAMRNALSDYLPTKIVAGPGTTKVRKCHTEKRHVSANLHDGKLTYCLAPLRFVSVEQGGR